MDQFGSMCLIFQRKFCILLKILGPLMVSLSIHQTFAQVFLELIFVLLLLLIYLHICITHTHIASNHTEKVDINQMTQQCVELTFANCMCASFFFNFLVNDSTLSLMEKGFYYDAKKNGPHTGSTNSLQPLVIRCNTISAMQSTFAVE